MNLLDRLRRDHANLQRLLDLLNDQLDDFDRGEEGDVDLKTELMDYMEAYSEHIHHPTEELIYQALLPRIDKGQKLLERLEREHVELLNRARRFRNSLEGIMQGEVISREEVTARGREFTALERQHVALEEREVYPLLEQAADAATWAELERQAPQGDDPLFIRQDRNRFAGLVEYLRNRE